MSAMSFLLSAWNGLPPVLVLDTNAVIFDALQARAPESERAQPY